MSADRDKFIFLLQLVAKGSESRVGFSGLMESFLTWIEGKTDFFSAPASTKYHGSEEGGLLHHSLLVYQQLSDMKELFGGIVSESSAILVGLLHDLCKINTYVRGKKNQKDENGRWQEVPVWEIKDNDPLGHGEKSLIILYRRGIGQFLSPAEEAAIRWHMGGWDASMKDYVGSQIGSRAADMYPLVRLAQAADLQTVVLEGMTKR